MPWRVVAHGDEVWHVGAVAERRAHTACWPLMLSFRITSGRVRDQAFWAPYRLETTSKSALFLQAERIPDAALSTLLAERLA